MIGQSKLLTQLNSYTLDTVPHSLLFIGSAGYGKHLFTDYLAKKLHTPLVDLTKEDINPDKLIEIQQSAVDKFYRVCLADFNEKQQNQLLKFIEEPSNTVHILLLANSKIGILPTVLNRCSVITFEPYTVEQLKSITNIKNEFVYKFCTSPGTLQATDDATLDSMKALCELIIKYTAKANYANTLKNELKINYKEDYTKFDFNLFLDMLEYVAYSTYIDTNSKEALVVYQQTNKYRQYLMQINPIKENFMISFLTELWETLVNDNCRV